MKGVALRRVFTVAGWMITSLCSLAGPGPGISFIENKHQWKSSILFKAYIPQADIALLSDRIQYVTRRQTATGQKGTGNSSALHYESTPHSLGGSVSTQLFEVTFINGNADVRVEPDDIMVTTSNYFIGNDRSRWASNARNYSSVWYRNVFCNIDLKLYSESNRLKQDWVVLPYGDPDLIQLHYNGVESMQIDNGNLVVTTNAGEITELKPIAYQVKQGKHVPLKCSFRLKGDVLSYSIDETYDESYSLTIDPVLIFSGYSGSTYDNWGNSATNDDHGNLYSGGMVTQLDGGQSFPTTAGSYQTTFRGGEWDVAILKYDSSGANVLYATYLGGNGTESPQSLVVNKLGQLLIMGATSSTNFPVTNGSTFKGGVSVDPLGGTDYTGGSDLFIARLSEDGSQLLSATYLGGTSNDGLNFVSGSMESPTKEESPLARNYGDQLRGDIITDASNFVYVASNTLSSDFPVVNADPTAAFHGGRHDAVLVKLRPDLSSIVWSRLLGGSGSDAAYSLKLDGTNGIYIAGGTNSANFTGMNGLNTTIQGSIDGWVAHVAADGQSIINSTYLGTSSYDQAYFIDLNTAGEVYAFGQTSGSYPIHAAAYSNPNSGQFIHKLTANLGTTLFSTVVGSGRFSPDISPTAFLVSNCGTIYLSGWGGDVNAPNVIYPPNVFVSRNYVGGSTRGLPVTPDAYQHSTFGSDFYFMVLSSDVSTFLYGTFLGGDVSATHVDGGTSRFDKKGVVYHAVCAGCGGESDFPVKNVPPSRQLNLSRNCNNAAFKFDLASLRARIQTNNIFLSSPGYNKVCLPDKIVFQNLSIGGVLFKWDFGDGTSIERSDTALAVHQYLAPGDYVVRLKAIDNGTCIGKDSTSVVVHAYVTNMTVGPDQVICAGSTTNLIGSGGVTYGWHDATNSWTATGPQPAITPDDTTVYYVIILDQHGCSKRDTVNVKVVPGLDLRYDFTKVFDCFSRPALKVKNQSDPVQEVFFDFGDGTTSDLDEDVHVYQQDGSYKVSVVGKRDFCVFDKSENIPMFELKVPNVITPGITTGKNDKFVIEYGGRPLSESVIHSSITIYNRWGGVVYQNSDYKDDWAGENVVGGFYYFELEIEGETHCKDWLHVVK